jgi:hypothetical protein
MMRRTTLFAARALVAAACLLPMTAMADPITVNPSAAGVSGSSFQASFIDFSYVALVDQTATNGTGTFNIDGGGFFSSFRHPDLPTPVLNTGLNSNYKMYATFNGTGTVIPNGVPGGMTATYNAFQMNIFVDKNSNTTIVADGVGAPNGTVTTGGTTSDDVLVGSSTGLIAGESHIFAGLANGDYNVTLRFNPVGGFLSGPFTADFNGVYTSLQGVTTGTFVDGRIDGSGNVSFGVIPEPGTLLLIGSGLAALGWMRRKQSI